MTQQKQNILIQQGSIFGEGEFQIKVLSISNGYVTFRKGDFDPQIEPLAKFIERIDRLNQK